MYSRILVPTDGSEHVERVVAHALDIAERDGATVHGLYVVDKGGMPELDAEMRDEVVKSFERTGAGALDEFRELAEAGGADVVTATAEGKPSKEIVEYVEDNDVDLIVMGTHGRSGIRNVLMGSVAERVVRHSPVPVLLVNVEQGA
ncbi:universal stress protein (plasmid) [Halorussus salilacus]|uniref:universal stress protein n=1 Tax=Halorussus salilacus TaxID=2953750 RepID=UPI00209EA46A|nr:universal stress protein [Halorussus salilacus]USZ69996.1 universal stress protein [Halorussus salilacus]